MDNKERVLHLSDLLAMLLRSFKTIVCIALAAALLCSAFAFFKSSDAETALQSAEKSLTQAETRLLEAEAAVSAAEKEVMLLEDISIPAGEGKLDMARAKAERFRAYYDNNPLLTLDQSKYGCSSVFLAVKSENGDESTDESDLSVTYANRASVIRSICSDNTVLENVRQILSLDADLPYVLQFISVTDQNGVIEIKVIADDPQKSEAALDYLCSAAVDSLDRSGSEYALSVIGRYTDYSSSDSINSLLSSLEEQMSACQQSLMDAETELRALKEMLEEQKAVLLKANSDYESAQKNYEAKLLLNGSANQSGFSASKLLRYALLGFAVGLFIGALAVICRSIFGVRLCSAADISGRYAFPLLGLLPGDNKRLFDKTIKRLEGESDVDYDTAARTAAQSLLAVSGDRSVCLVSSQGSKDAESLLPYLDGRAQVCGDILGDPNAVKTLLNCNAVALIERRGRSDLIKIDNEVMRAEALGKDVIGIILN